MKNHVLFYDYWHQSTNSQEIAFYAHYAQQTDGPILELGCGTGRLLLPLAHAGYHIEGLDIDATMLALCTKKAADQKIPVTLHQQSISSLYLQKKYALIISALETFQHITDYQEVKKALNAIYTHLTNNGTLLIYLSLPWLYAPKNASTWRMINRTIRDKKQYTLHEKSIHDPLEQLYHHTYQIKEDNHIIHEYKTEIRWYARHEFETLLRQSGFNTITVQSGYNSDGPFDCMIFIACK